MSKLDEVESLDDWKNCWVDNDFPWHKKNAHENLVEFFGQCATLGQLTNALLPLCGKAVDMKWLYDQGCRVCGVEISELPAKAFFEEQNIKYERTVPETAENFVLYQSEDKKISIYCGDFFQFSKATVGYQFDFVWDRGAFVAINVSDRKRYVETVRNLLLPTGRILLSTVNYDPAKYGGPPHHVTPEDITSCYGAKFHINHLNTRDVTNENHKKQFGVDWYTESCDMLSLKS